MTDVKQIIFEDFKAEWLEEIKEDNPSTVQLGNRFAKKLILQWLDFSEDTDDIIFCDGSGDGGIDVAFLQKGDILEENTNEGDTWYLIQSKYGSAFSGVDTLLREAQKVIETLDGKNKRLSSLATDVLERLQNFRSKASQKDKLVLVFASIESLSEKENRVINDIKAFGKARIGEIFGVETISVETIYQRIADQLSQFKKYKLPFTANLVPSGNDLLVGSIKLDNLYNFLKDYKKETGDIDLLYEKNVRKFLGSAKKVNKGIAETIENNPERFGLYNNGITVVVEDFYLMESDKYELTEPYIVNGCQTTRTIWETLYKKLESGGTGIDLKLENWKNRLKKGIVVVKIVKIGENGNEILKNTTRYTNSQNSIVQKDFIALEDSFKDWAKEMGNRYNVFLEIQRGGWDSQKTLQKINPNTKIYKSWVNAFDLLKTYGAGWLGKPGIAFGKNPPFAPGGSIFKKIVDNKDSFGINDLYAAYLINRVSQIIGFGRHSKKMTRGQSRFLFIFVLIELLKKCMIYVEMPIDKKDISNCIIRLCRRSELNTNAMDILIESSLYVIDDYLTLENEDSIFKESNFPASQDLNAFLKWEKLGEAGETPNLTKLINFAEKDMRRNVKGQTSSRDIIAEALKFEIIA